MVKDDLRDVEQWRFECLERAGYDREAALKLADSHCDLHQAILILHQGSTVEQALLILL